jgi:uncharacterized membrane protein YqaE (UPF0057 family)
MKHSLNTLLLLLLLPATLLHASSLIIPVKDTGQLSSREPSRAEVTQAIAAFKAMSGKEKRNKFREVKKEIRQYRASAAAEKPANLSKTLLIIIAILLPPLAIYLFEGEIRKCFWISILLTLLFWLPGVIYAIVIINKDWKKYHPEEKK